jgi:CheY-like chemotaxis protein
VQALAAMASMASRPVPARKDSPAEAIARASAPGGRTALVVGFVAGERARVASQLTLSGVTVETAEDGFVALGMAERSVYLHGGLDLLVLDASLDGLPVQALLSRLKGHVDFDRLRIVLISAGRIAGAFGGTPDGKAAPAASDLDALVAGIFGKVPVPAELQAGASGRTGQQRMLAQ